jgi:hypothetical protein
MDGNPFSQKLIGHRAQEAKHRRRCTSSIDGQGQPDFSAESDFPAKSLEFLMFKIMKNPRFLQNRLHRDSLQPNQIAQVML